MNMIQVIEEFLNLFTDNRYFPNSARLQKAIADHLNDYSLLNLIFSWYVFGYENEIDYNQDVIRDIVNLDYKSYQFNSPNKILKKLSNN